MGLAIGTRYSAEAKSAKLSPELLRAYRTLIAITQEADSRMYDQLQDVVTSLRENFDARSEFPSPSDLVEDVARVNRRLAQNPYHPQEQDSDDSPFPVVVSPFDKPDETKPAAPRHVEPRVKVVIDGDFSPQKLQEMVDAGQDWHAEPGHIVVMTNGYDFMAGWAAGSNQKPIIDEQGKPRLVTADFGHKIQAEEHDVNTSKESDD